MKAIVLAALFGFVLAQISALPAPEEVLDHLQNESEKHEELERQKKSTYGGQEGYGAPAQAPAQGKGPAAGYTSPAAPGNYGPAPAKAPAYGAPAYGAPAHGAPSYGAPAYGAPAYGAPAHGAAAYGAPAYGSQAYAGPAHGAPAYGAPASVGYSYQVPASSVPCARNVLVSCSPAWSSVPCSSTPRLVAGSSSAPGQYVGSAY